MEDGRLAKTVRFVNPHNQVHPSPTKRIGEVAKSTHTKLAVASYVSTLKHAKPQPKDLDTQYDCTLERNYLLEWPDAVPQYQSKQPCCCCRDPERDQDTRELFQRVFPPFVFYFMVFTSALPAKYKWLDYFLRGFWHVAAVGNILFTFLNIVLVWLNLYCIISTNCHVYGSDLELSSMASLMVVGFAQILTTYLVPTYVRDLFRSRELQTLIASIGPGRVGRPRYYWWEGQYMVLVNAADCLCSISLHNVAAESTCPQHTVFPPTHFPKDWFLRCVRHVDARRDRIYHAQRPVERDFFVWDRARGHHAGPAVCLLAIFLSCDPLYIAVLRRLGGENAQHYHGIAARLRQGRLAA